MPPDAAVDMSPQTDNTTSPDVLAAIMAPPLGGDKKEEKKEPVVKAEDDATVKAEEKEAEGDTDAEGGDGDADEADGEDKEEKKEEKDGGEKDEDDLDTYVTDVVVDGKTVEVTLGDLKKNFSGNKFVEATMTKTVEARKAAEHQANTLFEVNKKVLARLTVLDNIVKAQAEPAIDWEALRKADPNAYLLKRDEQRVGQERQAQVQTEIKRVNEEQADIQATATQKYLDDQAELLVTKLPALGDPKQAKQLMADLEAGAKEHYGYTSQEFNSINDHRALLILHDAVENRKTKAKEKAGKKALDEGTTSEKKVLIRPMGQKTSPSSNAKRLDKQLMDKARATGKPDDVAATLIVRKGKG